MSTVTVPVAHQSAGSELVAAAQAGDVDAFGQLYAEYRDQVYGFLLRRTRNPQVAEELTQDTFVRALRAIGRWRDQGKDVRAWLITIARNLYLDHASATSRRNTVSVGDYADIGADLRDTTREGDPQAVALSLIPNAELRRALQAITDEQRVCLVLRYEKELSVSETASEMGRTHGAVKAMTYRALQTLAAELGRKPMPVDQAANRAIRRWAAERGVPCPPRGRIPAAVQSAYRRAVADA